jgi:class 3 adenylate cyclase
MEPQIRYARRDDGARTAFAVIGTGPVLIVPPGFLSNVEWGLKYDKVRDGFWNVLARHRTVVMYDRHGCGLSDRKRTDFTPDDDMRDLYAVIDASGADEIDLLGISFGGGPAVRFAAEHPDRVRDLILWGTAAGSLDPERYSAQVREQFEAMGKLRRSDPDGFMRLMATRMFPDGIDPQTFRDFFQLNRESATIEMQEKLQGVQFDNREILDQVRARTLIIHRRGDGMVPFAVGQFLARRLPGAIFAPIDGSEHLPWFGDTDAALAPILAFLDEAQALDRTTANKAGADAPASGTAIILFADIADSTALTERHGDAAFRERARTLDDALRAAVRNNGGTVIDAKTLGDGVLATFPAASQAIAAALACAATGDAQGLPLHLGLHAGDVIREQDNVFGGTVNIAARISAFAAPGEVLVSRTVADLARTSAGVTFEDRGERTLKGIDDSIRVFAVRPS